MRHAETRKSRTALQGSTSPMQEGLFHSAVSESCHQEAQETQTTVV